MEQDQHRIANVYDTVAKEYAAKFYNEHEKKPRDQEILYRFSQEVADRQPIWDFGCGPGQTAQYLKGLGIEISGLDLSEKLIAQARMLHPGIPFRRGNILDLEFEDGSIAGIVAFYAIVHFWEKQVERAFEEIFREENGVKSLFLTFQNNTHQHRLYGGWDNDNRYGSL